MTEHNMQETVEKVREALQNMSEDEFKEALKKSTKHWTREALESEGFFDGLPEGEKQ